MKFNRVNSDIKKPKVSQLQVNHYPSKHIKGKKYHAQAKNKYLEF